MKFTQDTVDVRQVKEGIFQTLTKLDYITTGRFIQIPAGYITDGYSKPQWSKFLVDGSFGDDIRPAILHDYLCQYKGYFAFKCDCYHQNCAAFIPLTFKEVNDLFEEAMIAVSFEDPINKKGKTKNYIPFWKRKLMRFAVNFRGR